MNLVLVPLRVQTNRIIRVQTNRIVRNPKWYNIYCYPWGENYRREDTKCAVCELNSSDYKFIENIGFVIKEHIKSIPVIFMGSPKEVAEYIMSHGGAGKAVSFGYHMADHAVSGWQGTSIGRFSATTGDFGTAMSESGTATAGIGGKVFVGERGTAQVGSQGCIQAGLYSFFTGGFNARVSASYCYQKSHFYCGTFGEELLPNVEYVIYPGTPKPVISTRFLLEHGLRSFGTDDFLSFLENNITNAKFIRKNYDLLVLDLDAPRKLILDNYLSTLVLNQCL